jgi:hypothetical protein
MKQEVSRCGSLSIKEARRSQRFPLLVSLEVSWQDARGALVTEPALAEEVNSHGGLLQMKVCPFPGQTIILKNTMTGETTEARVVSPRNPTDGKSGGVAVELLHPGDTFWGPSFQLRKIGAELVRLEELLRLGGVDLRVLRDFRDAVDYVRKTAWAVYESEERSLRHHDTATVIPLLTAERIRRATQLCHAILSDMATHEVTSRTQGVSDLYSAVERLQTQLACLFQRVAAQ